MLVNEMAYPAGGMNGKGKRPFFASPEDAYGNLAQYYDIPSISFRWVALCVCGLDYKRCVVIFVIPACSNTAGLSLTTRTIAHRDAMWQLGDNGVNGGAWSDFLSDDRLHPNDKGHRLMADMIIFTLQQVGSSQLLWV